MVKSNIRKNEHYFVRRPKSKKKLYKFYAKLFGLPLIFHTASGIFSPNRIDKGTQTLTKYMDIKRKSKVLDFGCGYGPVGIIVKKLFPSCEVTMVEVNERAVQCAKKNVEENNVEAKVKQSTFYSSLKGEVFDVILANPPISAGMEVCYRIIDESYDHLNWGGSLQMVAKKRKGGRRLMERMEERFGNLEVLGRGSGYWVFSSKKLE